jgi:hypothetical protein
MVLVAISDRKYMRHIAMLAASAFIRSTRDQTMAFTARISHQGVGDDRTKTEVFDLSFLPPTLTSQCAGLIESYHEIHGYTRLPNMLWRAELEGFIKNQPCLRQILRKASTARSAKVANKGFVEIATAILSLEILASDFASWSAMFPEAKSKANALLRMRSTRMFLMEYYLYPPKNISPAVLAALTPRLDQLTTEPGWHSNPNPELASQKLALNYANAMHDNING